MANLSLVEPDAWPEWARLAGSNGMPRVRPSDDLSEGGAPDVRPDAVPDNPVHAQIARLEGEFAGVREALTEARARARAAEARAETAEKRIENLLAELADRGAQHADERAVLVAQVGSERRNAEKAINALGALADRLDALTAASQRRPFWEQLMRRRAG